MTKIRRLFGCACTGIALVSTSTPALGAVPDPGDFQAPAKPALGPETIQVVARVGGGADVLLLNGPGGGDDVVLDGGGFPLIVALKNAIPGSEPVIGIYGRISQGGNGMQIGAGDSDSKAYVAHWGAVPMRFSVVGMTPDASIMAFGILNRMNNGTVHGGVEDARFENLTIESKYNSAVSGPKGHRFGLLRFYNCRFQPSAASLASGGHYGFGYKWGLRLRALGRYDIRDCTFAPVLEHSIYVDSPQGDNIFKGIVHEGSTRTAIQIVNRAFDTTNIAPFEDGTQTPQPSGFGRILIEDVTIHDLTGDGGSGITVAGFLGDVWIRNITAVDNGPFQGVIAVWTDAGWNHGAYLYTGADGGLYSSRSVTLENINVNLPLADRNHVAISGSELVRINGFSIAGNRTAISLDSTYGAAQLSNSLCVIDGVVQRSNALIVNGTVDFLVPRPVSQYAGWASAGKIKIGNTTLTNSQIDAMWGDPLPPACPPGEIEDCNGNCAPAAWVGDGNCDNGTQLYDGNLIDFSCGTFGSDGGDCAVVVPPRILWRQTSTGRNSLWFMDGTAVLPQTGVLPTVGDQNWTVVGTGDFDADGNVDILWRNHHRGFNVIWFMTGTSLAPDSQYTTPVTDGNWTVVDVRDFDGDGKADILWRHLVSGRNSLWFMDGATRRPESGALPTVGDQNWAVVGTGDFDADGNVDILWRNHRKGYNVIWFMTGTSLVPDVQYAMTVADTRWMVVGVRDFDGDGKADILWRHEIGRNALWFMDGATRRPESGVLPTRTDPDWTVAGTADFDGDGQLDILWRHVTTGHNGIWFMNGTTLVPEEQVMTRVNAAWSIVGTME